MLVSAFGIEPVPTGGVPSRLWCVLWFNTCARWHCITG